MKKLLLIFALVPAVAGAIDLNKNGRVDPYENPRLTVEERVEDLLGRMTVEEKTAQMATIYGYARVLFDSLPTPEWKNRVWKDGIANIDEHLSGYGGRAQRNSIHLIYPFSNHAKAINEVQKWFIEETRLGIPVDFSNEALHGLAHTKATPLPAPIGIGSTWNRALVRRAGEIAGREAKALGYTNLYAPILDPARDPRWGRIVECYGEDPFLIAELGVEMVEGIQSQGVASTLKHYAVYSIPKGGRDGLTRTDPHVAPREMHTLHMYPFKRVIQEAHPMGVMASYNDWDGVPVIASHYFMTELLRETYGFDGYTVSDSDAVEFVESKHHVAATYDDAARQVLEAGLNVRTNFSEPAIFIDAVRRSVASGALSMDVVDKRVGEVLAVKFRLGLFDHPYVENPRQADKIVGWEKNLDFIDRMQRESFVLLKNEGVLPLAKGARVLVTGPMANDTSYQINRYGPNSLPVTTVLKGLRDYLGEENVLYAKGCNTRDEHFPYSEQTAYPLTADEISGINEAVARAADVDVIIAVVGEDATLVGESLSRTGLNLSGRQEDLLKALHATGKPVVMVMVNGRPLTINWAAENVPAILETWFPSFRGGQAIAKTLFGEYNPGGKLTVTMPKTVGQIEYSFPFKVGSHGGQPQWSVNGGGFSRVTGHLYPFGHGLSYTTFEYSDLEIEGLRVACTVKNTGAREGDEVVQLYVSDPVSSVTTYESVLRDFERVSLAPGESKRVEFVLEEADLEILDRNMQWTVEPGEFIIKIGASSADIRLQETITWQTKR